MSDPASKHEYQSDFFEYINSGSTASARLICPLIVDWLRPRSLLDVGCGAGAWCRVWKEQGLTEVIGVDGAYVDRTRLLLPEADFHARDLAQGFDLGRRFDVVTSLEVAEHVPGTSSRVFVENLVRHGDTVLFSAAVPGQGGEFHVNEQPLSYWRDIFREHGFRCFDPLRRLIGRQRQVEPWYRYNTLMYVRDAATSALPEAVRQWEIASDAAIPDLSPASWRARNAVLRNLPKPAVEVLVRLKHALVRRLREPAP